jgi:hypothetical protein
LINCYPEPLAATAGKPNAYWRVPGLSVWGTTPSGSYRGGVVVAGTFYALFGSTVYTWTSLGGAGTALPGSIPGSQFCAFAFNQNSPPDIVVVSPGIGAFVINLSTGVANYPDANVGTPNSVAYHLSFFIFTYGNGKSVASNTDVLTSPPPTGINTINFAFANSKPDTLFRPVPLGNGQLLLCGSNTMEVWGGNNPTGYPFSYVSTIYRGIPGPQAIAGNEDGWGKGIFFVGDDSKVSTFTGYTPTPISIPDLDQMIEKEPDKTKIIVGVYVSRGHGFVVVQGPNWCWEYDTTLTQWHERRSYLQRYWRGYHPICLNFGSSPVWVCGDTKSSSLLQIDGTVATEGGMSEVQSIATTGTGGSFTLSFGGQVTPAIPYNATAAQVQTALFGLTALNGNVLCSGGPLPGTVTVTFVNQLVNSPQGMIALAINSLTGGTVTITRSVTGIVADPLRMRIETGPLGAFPQKVRVNTIELYMTKGASNALGEAPQETNAMVEISMSRDAGLSWGTPRTVPVGPQQLSGRARASIWGQADIQGVRWRFEESAAINNFAFMGADMLSDTLR